MRGRRIHDLAAFFCYSITEHDFQIMVDFPQLTVTLAIRSVRLRGFIWNVYLYARSIIIMKAIIILALTFTSSLVFAQTTTYGSFKLVDQALIYQKVFAQDSITSAKLAAYYQTLPYLANVTQAGEEVNFEFNDLIVDYKKFQFAQVGVPPIIQTGRYSGKAFVNVKEGKYRLTITNIQMTGNIGYKNITTKENLTNYACENNGTAIHQNWCKPNTLGLLEKAFTDKFQFVEVAKKKNDGDW
jgi:hypothetical protein